MKHLTKLTAILLALALCLNLLPASALAAGGSAAPAMAEDGTEPTIIASGNFGSNLTWTLTDNGVLRVSCKGEMTNYFTDSRYPWYRYRNDIKKVIFEAGITLIGAYSFYNYTALTDVVFPEGLIKINSSAFDGCSALREVNFPNSLSALGHKTFKSCSSLTSVYIPPNISCIDSAFVNCKGLKSAVIAGGNEIVWDVFQYCDALTDVVFLGNVSILGETFSNCRSLKEIALPNGLTKIEKDTFRYCTSLERIVIPSSVTKIDREAFIGCKALTDKYYSGSYEQWKQIEIGEKNTYLKRAKLHSYYKYIPYCDVSEPKYSVYAYTGQEIKPLIKVYTVSGTRLKEGTNYTVSYENNIYPGTAAIKITGIGKYSGTAYRFFRIRANKLRDLRIENGGATTATVKWTADPDAARYQVYLDNNLFGETADTELTLSNLDGKSHVVEARSIWAVSSASGEIEERAGLSAKVRLNSIADCRCTRQYLYYHSTKTPPVEVKTKKGTLLKKGLNYTVSYQRTEETDGYGHYKYRITVTGIGKYYGVRKLYFYYGRRPKETYGGGDWSGDDDDDDQGP